MILCSTRMGRCVILASLLSSGHQSSHAIWLLACFVDYHCMDLFTSWVFFFLMCYWKGFGYVGDLMKGCELMAATSELPLKVADPF